MSIATLEKAQKHKKVHVYKRGALPRSTELYDIFWRFAANRQEVFYNRFKGLDKPWTTDPILQEYKFTNVYRASDRTSQYLIKEVIYNGEYDFRNMLFRMLIFKTFNKIDTWEFLNSELGSVDLDTYSFKRYSNALHKLYLSGKRIYSGAYIMASGKSRFGYPRKYENHLRLIEFMLKDEVDKQLSDALSMEEMYLLLKRYPTIGEFLAYQYAIDINYSSYINFSEMEFVKAGPGAADGLAKCFSSLGGFSKEEVIVMVADEQEYQFERLGINFQTLWGRRLQLIDIQNIFCEISKYTRVSHPMFGGTSNRTRIKQRFHVSPEPINYFFPPKWGINKLITSYE